MAVKQTLFGAGQSVLLDVTVGEVQQIGDFARRQALDTEEMAMRVTRCGGEIDGSH